MEINYKQLRDYLLREVSSTNKFIMGILNSDARSNRDIFNNAFNEILDIFFGCKNSSIRSEILYDSSKRATKYSPYSYFDVNTLICYRLFLQKLFEFSKDESRRHHRTWAIAPDLTVGLKDVRLWLVNNAYTESSGYYNSIKPVSLEYTVRGGQTILNPRKALSEQSFNDRYDRRECETMYREYMENHPFIKKYDESSLISLDSDMSSLEIDPYKYIENRITGNGIFYHYNGKNIELSILHRQYFTDENGGSVIKLVATSKEGTLYGAYYKDGTVYSGDLYNAKGAIVELNGGGEEFYESKTNSRYFG